MTTGLRRDQIRGFEIRAGEVGTDELADGSVTTAKLGDNQVTTGKILDGTILVGDWNANVYGGTPTSIDPDDAGAAGTAITVSRSDHQHQATAATAVALTNTATSSEGVATTWSRSDHVHATDALPWGILAHQTLDVNNGAHSVDADTDMVLNNVSVVNGRAYAVHAHSQIDLNNGPGDWLIRLRLNGVDFRDLCRVQTTATDLTIMMDATVYWFPTVTASTDDLLVRVDEQSGTSDITLNGSAAQLRTLSLIDLGIL